MGEKKKVLLFSVTAEDCEWQTFRAGGKGGQHQNKTETGVRCIHRASGAVGEARDSRSQIENKRAAFQRMIESEAFQSWHRLEAARRMANERSIEAMVEKAVDQAMNPANLNVEVQDGQGRWIPEAQSSET
jgi:protein subunit release factor B